MKVEEEEEDRWDDDDEISNNISSVLVVNSRLSMPHPTSGMTVTTVLLSCVNDTSPKTPKPQNPKTPEQLFSNF